MIFRIYFAKPKLEIREIDIIGLVIRLIKRPLMSVLVLKLLYSKLTSVLVTQIEVNSITNCNTCLFRFRAQ